jgi:hypothetical protein
VRIVLSSAVKVNKCCGGFAAHLLVLTNSHVACLEPFQGTVTTASLTVAARTAVCCSADEVLSFVELLERISIQQKKWFVEDEPMLSILSLITL